MQCILIIIYTQYTKRTIATVIKVQKSLFLIAKAKKQTSKSGMFSMCRSGSMNSSHPKTADCEHTTYSTDFHLFL